MVIKLGDKVNTPNGIGTFQFPIWSHGERYVLISHPATAQIDPEKCKSVQGNGKGIWYLCGYETEQVIPA